MKLYQITEEFKALNSLYENGEIDAETLADTLAGVSASFEDKVRNCLMIRAEMEKDAQGIQAEIDRLKKLQSSNDKSIENLENYIKHNMASFGNDKLDLGMFKVTLRAPTKAVSVVDESKIPAQFWRVIPESKAVDKNALSAALKLGEVEGAELIEGKRALIIK